jgi:hypothetical protein
MKKVYRSALGRPIDIDQVRLNNEDVIAVGNMKVNARGDELGPGGEVLRTRNQVMNEYYKLNTPTVTASNPEVVNEKDVYPPPEKPSSATGLRGSLADSIAKSNKE